MRSRELAYVEAALADRCGRSATVSQPNRVTLRIVLEPVGDRGRLDLLATLDDGRWTLSDRGVFSRAIHDDFAFVITKLGAIGTPVRVVDDVILSESDDVSFVESVVQFVSNIEFIPVLAGLWSTAPTAA